MKHTISEKIGYWVDEGINEHAQGEHVLWEGSLIPGPNQEPIYTVFLWFPGAVLGSTLNGSFQIVDPLHITKADLVEMMADFLRQLREARSQIMAQQTQQATQQPLRGSQTPSGLLIP